MYQSILTTYIQNAQHSSQYSRNCAHNNTLLCKSIPHKFTNSIVDSNSTATFKNTCNQTQYNTTHIPHKTQPRKIQNFKIIRQPLPTIHTNPSIKHIKQINHKYAALKPNKIAIHKIIKPLQSERYNSSENKTIYICNQSSQFPTGSSTQLTSLIKNDVMACKEKLKSISIDTTQDYILEELAESKNTEHDPNASISPNNGESLKLSWESTTNTVSKNIPTTTNILSPENALTLYLKQLTDYEKKEILGYNEIYYVGLLEYKLIKLDPEGVNYGWDNNKAFYQARINDHIKYRYEVISVLGKGTFGQVYRCRDHKTHEEVAIKILRSKQKLQKQGKLEIDLLLKLNNPNKKASQFFVDIKDSFTFRNHIFIVFEILSIDLYSLIKSSKFSVMISFRDSLCLL